MRARQPCTNDSTLLPTNSWNSDLISDLSHLSKSIVLDLMPCSFSESLTFNRVSSRFITFLRCFSITSSLYRPDTSCIHVLLSPLRGHPPHTRFFRAAHTSCIPTQTLCVSMYPLLSSPRNVLRSSPCLLVDWHLPTFVHIVVVSRLLQLAYCSASSYCTM